MKLNSNLIAAVTLALAIFNLASASAQAQGTAFTYQGQLMNAGSPANGAYDFKLTLFDAVTNGNTIAGPVTNLAVAVSNGLFTTTIDFGDAFDGNLYWLRLQVRTNGANNFTTLSPRQQITPTPYAVFATTASNVSGTVSFSQLPAAFVTNNQTALTLNGNFSGNGAGMTNVNAATLNGLSGGNFWQVGGNSVSTGQFIGSQNNQPVEIWVDGQRALRLEPNPIKGAPNVIGGSMVNFVAGAAAGATIAGGGGTNISGVAYTNSVTANFGTVGGGYANTVTGLGATVGGGFGNTANNLYSGVSAGVGNTATLNYSYVGGGQSNYIFGLGSAILGGQGNNIYGTNNFIGGGNANSIGANWGTIAGGQINYVYLNYGTAGGGYNNIVNGQFGTIAGGNDNMLTGTSATIAGGYNNNASGQNSAIGGGGGNSASGANSTVGGGWINQATLDYATIGGGENNAATANSATVAGGNLNTASATYSTIGGGYENNVSGQYGIIAGGNNNFATATSSAVGGGYSNTAGGQNSAIGGGGANGTAGFASTVAGGWENTASADYATVAGGENNSAVGTNSFIGGGLSNLATNYSSVVGGLQNQVYGYYSAIVGGDHNSIPAGGSEAFIGGGSANQAGGSGAVVPGGYYNRAMGAASFAAGSGAVANYDDSFVWSDGSGLQDTGSGQFLIHAQGGVGINTNNPHGDALSVGGYMRMNDNIIWLRGFPDSRHGLGYFGNGTSESGASPDGPVLFGYGGGALVSTENNYIALQWTTTSVTVNGTFNNNSDRNAKEKFTPVSAAQILEKVSSLPLSEWSYKTDAATRHIGPMAQDFHAAFEVGTDEKHIAPIDEGGVALAAIQGLNQKLEAAKAENAELKTRLAKLERLMAEKLGGAK